MLFRSLFLIAWGILWFVLNLLFYYVLTAVSAIRIFSAIMIALVLLSSAIIFNLYDKIQEKTDALICQMHLEKAKDRLPAQVSGGEAQRAAVARAVITKPKILFADEPTGALNKANTEEVLDLLTALYSRGQSILLVTHDREAALRGNRILYLEDGAIAGELELSSYQGKDREREQKLASWLEGFRW